MKDLKKELRIGNLIYSKETSSIQKITGLSDENPFIDSITFDYTNYDEIEPIPITQEWLVKLGFTIEKKPNGDILYSYKEYRYSLIKKENYDGYLFCDDGNVLRDLEFIHELQNIYFALIVIELKLNND